MRIVLIGLAGAAGALSRYGIASVVGVRSFPWATLGINVAGSFALGVLLEAGPGRMSDDARVALGVGFLGAFTTFSTFGYESIALIRDGRVGAATAYVVASVVVGLAAAAVGYRIGSTW